MLHSPEIELLLLCARPRLDEIASGQLRSLLKQDLDWDWIFPTANYHRTIPLLAYHLHHQAADLLSIELQERLQGLHRDSTRHNLALAAELLRLIKDFARADIDVLSFKGPVSAILVHGDMAMRACGDIDLLVKPQDHQQAERLLQQQGYTIEQRFENAMQSTLWHKQRGVDIDLHWGIPPDTLKLHSEYLWENLEPINLLGQPVPTLSPVDTLLVTAINAVKEYWRSSLHHLSDIATLTSTWTNEEWLTAFQRARQIGCQRILVAALLLTHRMLNAPLPSAGPLHLFNHRSIIKAVDELQDHFFSETTEQPLEVTMRPAHHRGMQFYYLTLTDSPLRRSRSWLNWAFTANQADQDFVQLPESLGFLYVFLRPLRLLLKRL